MDATTKYPTNWDDVRWALRHPIYALAWLLFREPYLTVKARLLCRAR